MKPLQRAPRPRLRTAWAQIRHAPGRVASTIVAVALGVALAASILLVGEELPAAIEASVQEVVGHADLRIVARSGAGLDEGLLARIGAVPGVAVAAPVVSVPSFFDDEGAEQLTVWGIDLLNESALRLYGMEPGADAGLVDLGDPLVFASQNDSAIAPAALIERRHLRRGDAIRVVTPAGVRSIVLRGVLGAGPSARQSGSNVVVMDVYSAQILFDLQGRFTHIDVLVGKGGELARVQARLAAEVGPSAHVVPAGTRHAGAQTMLVGVQLLIRAMSMSGILLAVLLTFNRLSTVFLARQWEVGVSRAIGASPRIVTLELLKEAALVGILGAVIGVVAGGLLARAVAPMLVQIAEVVMGASVPPIEVPLRIGPLAISAALGIAATLAGALLPARDAARAPIAAALRARGLEAMPSERAGSRSWVVAGALALVSVALLWIESRTRTALPGLTALLLLMLAASMFARPALELLVPPFTRVFGWLLGPVGRLAARDLGLSSRRAGGCVRLVAIGLGIVIWFQVLIVSFEHSNAQIMGGSRRADLIVSSAYDLGSDMGPLTEKLLDELRAIPGVAAASGERGLFGTEFGLTAFDALHFRDPRLVAWTLDGPLASDALERVATGKALLVSPGFAAHHGVSVGDVATLISPTGPVRLPIAGLATASVYSRRGDLVIERDVYRRFWKDPAITRAHLVVGDGESAAVVRSRILRTLGGEHRLRIFTPTELADYYRSIVRRSVVLLRPMSLLVLIVVVLGIADALLATVLARTREIGTMRAIGTSPGLVGRFVVIQAIAICIVGAALAPVIALALAVTLLKVTSISLLGWPQDLVFPVDQCALLIGIGLLGALAGSALPAWRASHLPPVEALRSE